MGTAWIGHYAVRHGVLDVPNSRSSHLMPTPRGGGFSIVVVFVVVGSFVYLGDGGIGHSAFGVLMLSTAAIAWVGWIDDRNPLSPFVRLAIHSAAAFFCILVLGVPPLPFAAEWIVFDSTNYPLWSVGYLTAVLALVWCLNLFNFMDGIDGIAAAQAATTSAAAAAILIIIGADSPWLPYLLILCAASLGFLVWNWSPARIFMGDAASGFLGFLLGLFAVATSLEGSMNVWSWFILFGVFAVDATVTLIARALKKEKIYQAHRQHAYQNLALNIQRIKAVVSSPEYARAFAHRAVTLAVTAINLLWLFPLALTAGLKPDWGIILALVAVTPLVAVVIQSRKFSLDDVPGNVMELK